VVVCLAVIAVVAVVIGYRLNGTSKSHGPTGADWTAYLNGNARGSYARRETDLTPKSVPKLEPKWIVRGTSTISGQAIVVGRRVYWGSWNGLEHATDIVTGKELWHTYLGDETKRNCVPPHLGVASTPEVRAFRFARKRVSILFVGGGNGSVYALNAATGGVIWSRNFGSPKEGFFIWSSPAVYRGSVYVGIGSIGDCPLIPGGLVKLDARTGATEATFMSVPPGCRGATIWTSPTIDEASGTVFVTTGNSGACNRDEPLAEAFIALSAKDLSVIGSWRTPPDERVPDGDFGGTPTLFTARIDGSRRQLVGAVSKNGFYYAFDRADIGAGPVWQSRRISSLPDTIAPSAWDGRRLYVAGHVTEIDGRRCEASIRAIDPATGRFLWQDCLRGGAPNGALTAIPGVVFEGVGSILYGVRASDGAILFQYHDTSFHWFYAPVAIAHGALYVGNSDGRFFAFTPDGK
jgi:polyvinyl alcohol dehydrogenase (cytochrome)